MFLNDIFLGDINAQRLVLLSAGVFRLGSEEEQRASFGVRLLSNLESQRWIVSHKSRLALKSRSFTHSVSSVLSSFWLSKGRNDSLILVKELQRTHVTSVTPGDVSSTQKGVFSEVEVSPFGSLGLTRIWSWTRIENWARTDGDVDRLRTYPS